MFLDDAHRKTLIDFFMAGTKREYEKGAFIVRPGETPDGVLYIERGLVKTYDITKYGEENLLVLRKDGDLLGITLAITADWRPIIYTALAPTIIWHVSTEQFLEFLEQTPKATLPLLSMVTDMYRMTSERILNLEYRTVRERLVSFIITTAERFGTKTNEGILIDIPLRHQDIASSISATRETTGRELTALERRGMLINRSLSITITDLDALKHYL